MDLLATFLRRYIREGSLTVTTAAGRTYTFGDGSGPAAAVRFTTAKAQREVLFNPQLRLGEAYMDGWWDCQRLDELFNRLLVLDEAPLTFSWTEWVGLTYAHVINKQSARRAKHVIRAHYDLSNVFFENMLEIGRAHV